MKILLLLICCLPVTMKAVAQDKASIRGRLVDSTDKQPLSLATVSVFSARDTLLITYRLSDAKGEFHIPGLPVNKALRAVISFSGYHVLRKEFTLATAQSSYDMGRLSLLPDTGSMEEVLVLAERPPVVIRKDTIEFNASSFKTLPTALVEDLLKKLPGVNVNKDGAITVNGKKVSRIMVDGKEFFGRDPKIATRNLPADIIDKVQVTSDKDLQRQNPDINEADLEQVINLKLKKNIKKGWFGKVYAGTGTDKRYETGGIANLFRDTTQVSVLGFTNNINNAGFSMDEVMDAGGFRRSGISSVSSWAGGGFAVNGISFGGIGEGILRSTAGGANFNTVLNKKFTVNLQYFYGATNTRLENISNTRQFINDTVLTTRNTTMQESDAYSHRIGGSIRWKPDTLTEIQFRPQISVKKNSMERVFNSYAFSNYHPLLNKSTNMQRTDGNDIGQEYLLSYYRNSRNKKRSVYVSGSFNNGNPGNDQYNNITDSFYQPQPYRIQLDQLREENANNLNSALAGSYNDQLSKKWRISISQNISYFKNDDALGTYNKDNLSGKYDILNPDLTNHSRRQGLRTSGDAGLTYSIKNFNIRPGISYQSSDIKTTFLKNAEIHQHLFYIFPALSVKYKSLSVRYSAYFREPSAADLQPVTDNTNSVYQQLGNPSLKPTRSHSVSLDYSLYRTKHNISIRTAAHGTVDQDAIIRERFVDSRGIQVTRPLNINGNSSAFLYFVIAKEFKANPDWQLTLNTALYSNYSRSTVLVNNNRSHLNVWSLNPTTGYTFNWHDKYELNQNYSLSWNKSSYNNNAFSGQRIITHYLNSEIVVRVPKHWVWESSVNYSHNPQVASGIRKSSVRWNAGVTFMFLKDEKGLLKLSVYDLLNQNISVDRTVQENYIQDNQTTILRRYFLLTFTYNIRNFNAKKNNRKGLFQF